jgi:hypothetical protein
MSMLWKKKYTIKNYKRPISLFNGLTVTQLNKQIFNKFRRKISITGKIC